jgi:hypothetical protein
MGPNEEVTMSDPTNELFTPEDQAELKAAWSGIVEQPKTGSGQDKALGFGLNLRINVAKAFKAVWTTAKIFFAAEKIKLTGDLSPATLMGVASDAFTLVVATLDALREKMGGAEYVACVVLSHAENGVAADGFKTYLQEFISKGLVKTLPWYTLISQPMIKELETALKDDDGFEALLGDLDKKNWLERKDDKLFFKPRNIVLQDA